VSTLQRRHRFLNGALSALRLTMLTRTALLIADGKHEQDHGRRQAKRLRSGLGKRNRQN